MTIDISVYQKIERLATKRGLTTQEFIRAIILPDWLDIEKKQKINLKSFDKFLLSSPRRFLYCQKELL